MIKFDRKSRPDCYWWFKVDPKLSVAIKYLHIKHTPSGGSPNISPKYHFSYSCISCSNQKLLDKIPFNILRQKSLSQVYQDFEKLNKQL